MLLWEMAAMGVLEELEETAETVEIPPEDIGHRLQFTRFLEEMADLVVQEAQEAQVVLEMFPAPMEQKVVTAVVAAMANSCFAS